MKMILAVVSKKDSESAVQELMRGGFSVTKIASSGGFLKKSITTILIGTHAERVDQAVDILRQVCKSRKYDMPKNPARLPFAPDTTDIQPRGEIRVGGATVFVLNIEQSVKL